VKLLIGWLTVTVVSLVYVMRAPFPRQVLRFLRARYSDSENGEVNFARMRSKTINRREAGSLAVSIIHS